MSALAKSYLDHAKKLKAGRPIWELKASGKWSSRSATKSDISRMESLALIHT